MIATIDPPWIKSFTRWVNFFSNRLHLLNEDIFRSLCKPFGNLKDIDLVPGRMLEILYTRILVEECDLLKIPHIMPIFEEGRTYPIRTSRVKDTEVTEEWIEQVGLPLRQMIGITVRSTEHARNAICTVITRRTKELRGDANQQREQEDTREFEAEIDLNVDYFSNLEY